MLGVGGEAGSVRLWGAWCNLLCLFPVCYTALSKLWKNMSKIDFFKIFFFLREGRLDDKYMRGLGNEAWVDIWIGSV